jgi:hypothetical protein
MKIKKASNICRNINNITNINPNSKPLSSCPHTLPPPKNEFDMRHENYPGAK